MRATVIVKWYLSFIETDNGSSLVQKVNIMLPDRIAWRSVASFIKFYIHEYMSTESTLKNSLKQDLWLNYTACFASSGVGIS